MSWIRKLRSVAASHPQIGRAVRGMARIGYSGRGLFYLILAGCAFVASLYARHNRISEPVVLGTLVNHWWGIAVVAALAVTFACYALWLIWTGFLLPHGDSPERKQWMIRISRFGTALVFIGMALAATGLLFGLPPGKMQATPKAAKHAMELGPWGRWAVGVIGALVTGASLAVFYHAWQLPLDEKLPLHRLRRPARVAIVVLARAGHTARAMVIAVTGFFLILAAVHNRAGEAQSPSGSLRELEFVPYGPSLLALIAIGLAAYGLYLVIAACFRPHETGATPTC